MKHLILFLTTLFLGSLCFASSSYMNSGRVQTAIESLHGVSAGVGSKNGSCLLCHGSSSGGPSNINSSFGQDFVDAALRVIGTRGGNDLAPTGPNSLASIFSETQFKDFDSDGDGRSNEAEFIADDDPAGDISESSSDSAGDSGGCGMIAPTGRNEGFPPSGFLIVLLPLAVIFGLRRQSV